MIAVLSLSALAQTIEPPTAGGTATIPVAQLLELQAPDQPAVPPVGGVVHALSVRGQVLDDALDVTVSVRASVLAETGWTELPLFEVGSTVDVTEVPTLPDAWLSVQDGTLVLVAKKSGEHQFDVRAIVRPEAPGPQRVAKLRLRPATSASLTLSHDPAFVDLRSPSEVHPRDGALTAVWRSRGKVERAAVADAPTADPIVERATTSVVSTLEGTWWMRSHFALRFQGQQALDVRWPEGFELSRIYVNGRAVTPERSEAAAATITVSPARSGGDEGTIEIVVSSDGPGYLLQGSWGTPLPGVSWPVREWSCVAHLPDVFDYASVGGSMTPITDPVDESVFTHRLPTPGSVLAWRQELVFERPPTLRLDYTVNLDGAVFRP